MRARRGREGERPTEERGATDGASGHALPSDGETQTLVFLLVGKSEEGESRAVTPSLPPCTRWCSACTRTVQAEERRWNRPFPIPLSLAPRAVLHHMGLAEPPIQATKPPASCTPDVGQVPSRQLNTPYITHLFA